MENELIIGNSNNSFDEYFNTNNISIETQNKLSTVDLLAVPRKYKDEEFFFAQETIAFLKYCKQNSTQYKI